MLLLVTQLIDNVINGDMSLQAAYAVHNRDRYKVILFNELDHIVNGGINLGAYYILIHHVLDL